MASHSVTAYRYAWCMIQVEGEWQAQGVFHELLAVGGSYK